MSATKIFISPKKASEPVGCGPNESLGMADDFDYSALQAIPHFRQLLSNQWQCGIEVEGAVYATVDHFLMARMFVDKAKAAEIFSIAGPAAIGVDLKLAVMACSARGTVTKTEKADGVKTRKVIFTRPKELVPHGKYNDIENFPVPLCQREEAERIALFTKFSNPFFKRILLATGNAELWYSRGFNSRGIPLRFTMLEWVRHMFQANLVLADPAVYTASFFVEARQMNADLVEAHQALLKERKRLRKEMSSATASAGSADETVENTGDEADEASDAEDAEAEDTERADEDADEDMPAAKKMATTVTA